MDEYLEKKYDAHQAMQAIETALYNAISEVRAAERELYVSKFMLCEKHLQQVRQLIKPIESLIKNAMHQTQVAANERTKILKGATEGGNV
jgi:hypothetical protein